MSTQMRWDDRRGFGVWAALRSRRRQSIGFDMVCVPKDMGMRVLESLVLRRIPLGPVVVDLRDEVPRIGFLVPADDTPDRAALQDWVAQSGSHNSVRLSAHRSSTMAKSVFRIPLGRLRWVIPPGGDAGDSWPVLGLLAALADATTPPDTTRFRW